MQLNQTRAASSIYFIAKVQAREIKSWTQLCHWWHNWVQLF